MTTRTKKQRGSLAYMGLENWLNHNYKTQGGYAKWLTCLSLGYSNGQIGVVFGAVGQPLSREAIRKWRLHYEEVKR